MLEKFLFDLLTDFDRIYSIVKSFRLELKYEKFWRRQKILGIRERKVVIILGLILGVFVICWLFFFVKELVVNVCEKCKIFEEMLNFLVWFGYLNFFINLLIYIIFNEDFKKVF